MHPRSADGPDLTDTRRYNIADRRRRNDDCLRLPSPRVSGRRTYNKRTGRGALAVKSAPADARPSTDAVANDAGHLRSSYEYRRAESHGSTLRSHPFTSERFHVLLNSLFKVLFNFPSRYLSAIGLVSVFSLRWSLPPTLGCIHKQPDSEDEHRAMRTEAEQALHPLWVEPRSGGLRRPIDIAEAVLYTTVPAALSSRGFGAGLFPLHSPLLGESLLVSFPPLSDMLKFSG